ncbi:MAG: RND transporter [Clostridiales bacterium]|nr:MMPL family transporter [Clostridiales bacterium]PWM40683.1 MAG: RND transporter [Clostridiales bacterium]
MEENHSKAGGGFMAKLATFIVDKRNLFFLLTVILLIFSAFSRNWVEVESELAAYLPEDSGTRQALDIMEEQFTTFGSAQVMAANITQDQAEALRDQIAGIKGVQGVEYDNTEEHYNNDSALYTVTFDYDESDDACLDSLEEIKSALSAYDLYVSTELGNTEQEAIDREVSVIMVYVAVIIVVVLLFTSQTYAEVPVLILTFVVAMILNLGTNFLLGKISFVSNSVTSILQLALSLDYAVIFCNRYKEEHKLLPIREAVIVALSKAIPEIGASSLTTIGGLVAMMFMQFRIGADMAVCLVKSILFALLSVFVVMPGLLMLFGPLMDRTEHRNFVPKIPFVGKFAYKTRFVVPVLFVVAIAVAFPLSQKCPYAYGESSLETPVLNETQIAENMIHDNFTSTNMLALMVPAGDYEKEAAILSELEQYAEVDSAMGIANVEAMDGYTLADQLSPREFAELAGLDYEAAQVVYGAYAASQEEYGQIIGNLDNYEVPLIDMFLFVCEQVDSGIVTLDEEQTEMLNNAYTQMTAAKEQLQGTDYSRMLVYLTLPESGEETYQFLDTIQETAQKYYPDGKVCLAGNSTTEYDFQKAFARDNMVVSVVSILIVLVVLLFTFKSAGMPVLLILVIQGSIWINFSMPYLLNQPLFFMSYLVVSSIQMGANIDYAIVVANRYQELKGQMPHRDAIIETMNFAFPTIITSGTILAVAGTLIGLMTSTASITGIGQNLGRGTILSILLVMFVLPQLLLIGGKVVDMTAFSMPNVTKKHSGRGRVRVDGLVRGEVHGVVSGVMHAIVDGEVDLNLISGVAAEEEDENES